MFQLCARNGGPSPSRRWQDSIEGDPYIKCVLQKFRQTYCHNCFSTMINEMCQGCNMFFYCSVDCMLMDCRRGHEVECGLLEDSTSFSDKCSAQTDEGALRLLLLRLYSTQVMHPEWLDLSNPHMGHPASFNRVLAIEKSLSWSKDYSETRHICRSMADFINGRNPPEPVNARNLMIMADVIRRCRFSIVDIKIGQQVGWGLHIVPHYDHERDDIRVATSRGLRLQALR